MRGLDAWITREEVCPEPSMRCEDCGEWSDDCRDVHYRGQDILACPKCRSIAEDDDEAADRGDWEYHNRF